MKRIFISVFTNIVFLLFIMNTLSAQVEDEVIQKYLDDYIKTGNQQMVEKIKQEASDSKYYRFCQAYELLNINNDEGLLLSRQLVRDNPDFAEANFALGTFMINVPNHYDSAIYYLDRAIELKPDFKSALFNRGIGEINLRFFDAAKSDFSKVIETDSMNAGAYLMRAVSEFMLKDDSSMLADIKNALRIDPFILSDLYFLQVRKTIDKSIELAPENVSLIAARGYANFKSGYFRLAVNDFAMALKLAPRNSEYYKMMGVCKLYLNDAPGAESDLKTALNINPSDAQIYYFLGLHASDLLGQPEKSIEYLSKAIELDSLNPLYYYQRALMSYNLYEYEATLLDIDKAIKLDSHNGDYYSLRALALLDGNLKTDLDYCKNFRTAKELGTNYQVDKYISTFCLKKQ
jgi:tetratricopeptide (TPR) repeat protein